MFVYPYKQGSKSSKTLSDGLKAKRILLEGSSFKGGSSKIVLNWGNSTPNTEVEKCIVLNSPSLVKQVTNKRNFFEMVEGQVNIPDFTIHKEVANSWVVIGNKVVVREKLTGHSGEGIVILETLNSWDQYSHDRARLYVKYIPKKEEYRVHVLGGEVILTQRKAKRNDVPKEAANYQVRSHANGFVFVKNEDHTPPEDVFEQAVNAIKITGLDFGAVDVIYNVHHKKAYVLEINTAPGLEGTTGDTYIEALLRYIPLIEGLKQGQVFGPKKERYDVLESLLPPIAAEELFGSDLVTTS